jgi:hypothetical protein
LRHISNVHKVLAQTVPDSAKTDQVREMEIYLAAMIRQVDSSLLEEWERMRNPAFVADKSAQEIRPPGAEEAAKDITRDTKAFTSAIRDRVFRFLRGLLIGDFEAAYASLRGEAEPSEPTVVDPSLKAQLDKYFQDHETFLLTPEARNLRFTFCKASEDRKSITVQQVLVDPEGHNDWAATFEVDLQKSRELAEPVLKFIQLAEIGK